MQRAAYRSAQGDVLAQLAGTQWGLPEELLYDAELGSTCQLETTDQVTRCLPNDLSGGDAAYADAGCMNPVVPGWDPGAYSYYRANHAGSAPTFRKIGPPTTVSDIYSLGAGVCTLAQHFDPALKALELGDEITVGAFQVFEAAEDPPRAVP